MSEQGLTAKGVACSHNHVAQLKEHVYTILHGFGDRGADRSLSSSFLQKAHSFPAETASAWFQVVYKTLPFKQAPSSREAAPFGPGF